MRASDAIAIAYVASCLAASLAIVTLWGGWTEPRVHVFIIAFFTYALVLAAPGWAVFKVGLQYIWPSRLVAGPLAIGLDGVLHMAMGVQNSAFASIISGHGLSDYRLALPGSVAGLAAFTVERLLYVAYPPSRLRTS